MVPIPKGDEIVIHDISQDIKKLEQARKIFIDYFIDLYQDIPALTLGIKTTIPNYLTTIFNGTLLAINEKSLHAYFAYHNDQVVGFSTWNQLENKVYVLLRTLPINIEYKAHELEIRNKFLEHIFITYPDTKKVINMVRKANHVHQDLCLKMKMQEDASCFEGHYIKKTYDKEHYVGFVYQNNIDNA